MTQECVVVCVTDQQSCVRLIDAGNQLANNKGCDLHVLSVSPSTDSSRVRGDALEYLFAASREVGAEMFVFYNNDPIHTTLDFIESKHASDLVLGVGPDRADGFVQTLIQKSHAIIHVIGKNGEHLYPSQQVS